MQIRSFENGIISVRQDKYETILKILESLEKLEQASVSQLNSELADISKSVISRTVRWLSGKPIRWNREEEIKPLKRIILKDVFHREDKPGRPEIFYKITEPNWRDIIRPINLLRENSFLLNNLAELVGRLYKHSSKLRLEQVSNIRRITEDQKRVLKILADDFFLQTLENILTNNLKYLKNESMRFKIIEIPRNTPKELVWHIDHINGILHAFRLRNKPLKTIKKRETKKQYERRRLMELGYQPLYPTADELHYWMKAEGMYDLMQQKGISIKDSKFALKAAFSLFLARSGIPHITNLKGGSVRYDGNPLEK